MTSKELSQKIINLTHAYMREVEEFIRARDMAGMHACEERWREEVESVCIESMREIQEMVMSIKADMREVLSSLDKPTTKPEEHDPERLMISSQGVLHFENGSCAENGCAPLPEWVKAK